MLCHEGHDGHDRFWVEVSGCLQVINYVSSGEIVR
jgi:hypothetical protein